MSAFAAAVRVLREELHWLAAARKRVVDDLGNPNVPIWLMRRYLVQLDDEMSDVAEALKCLTCDLAPEQAQLAFDYDEAGRVQLVAA